MDLNFRHLYYFWQVARDGKLTRTARRLHIAQSALSIQIKALEDYFSHELFHRDGRSLELTELGRVVLSYADTIFSLGSELQATVGALEHQGDEIVRIGSVATLSRNFQEKFFHPLLEAEHVSLVLESGSLEQLLDRLFSHRLHLVLTNRAVTSHEGRKVRCRELSRQAVCVIGPPRTGKEIDKERAKKKPFSFPSDLGDRKLIIPGSSSQIRTSFDLICDTHNFQPQIFAEIDDMALLRLMTKHSHHLAIAPSVVVHEELTQGTLEVYCDVPELFEHFYAISLERQFAPKSLTAVLATS